MAGLVRLLYRFVEWFLGCTPKSGGIMWGLLDVYGRCSVAAKQNLDVF